MPFSIDAHRNPSAQYFANRSFIAKQVGDMRDVGAAVGYIEFFTTMTKEKAEKITKIYDWARLLILAAFFAVVYFALASA